MNRPAAADDDDLEARARRRVGMKIGFYVHATVYAIVNLGLFAISSLTGRGSWHWFPLLGWGLGLGIHGLVTFIGLRGEGVRDRMIADEVERLRRRP